MKRELKHLAGLGLLSFVLVPASSPFLPAQNKSQDNNKKEEPAPMKLKVGDPAPDFTLLAFDGKELTKSRCRTIEERKTSR